ncbi:MAG: DUF4384 domain-containing protein [Desulfomonilaceae bacterium]|nr:DUF4384 domain-containing protein [Desulfomonilaceae bacterium]
MTKILVSLVTALVVSVGLNPTAVTPACGSAIETTADASPLLSIGRIGADAIKLTARTNIPKDRPARIGERIVVHFSADRDCSVVVANVSADGSVTIVFPNKERPDNRIEAGKDYKLFGRDSTLSLVLGKGAPRAALVFYASPQPIDLAPLRISGDNPAIVIPASSKEELEILKDKIEQVSKVKGFSRKVLWIKRDAEGKAGRRLMGSPAPKGVRPERASEELGDVTGTRGRAEDLKEPEKDR